MVNGSLVAFRESTGTVKYQHTDALGTPVAVTDAAKAIGQTHVCRSYVGLLANPTSPKIKPPRRDSSSPVLLFGY